MLTLDVKHGQLWQRWAWQASWGYLHSNYYNDEVEHDVVQEFTELNVGKFEEHEESVELGLISHSAKQIGGTTLHTLLFQEQGIQQKLQRQVSWLTGLL